MRIRDEAMEEARAAADPEARAAAFTFLDRGLTLERLGFSFGDMSMTTLSGRDGQVVPLAGAGVVESYPGDEGTQVDITARHDGRYGVTLFDTDAGEDLGITYIYDTLPLARAKAVSIVGSSGPEEG